jgi:hypothetical protein
LDKGHEAINFINHRTRLRISALEGAAGRYHSTSATFSPSALELGRIIAKQTHSLRFTGLSQLHPDSRMQLRKPVAHKNQYSATSKLAPEALAERIWLSNRQTPQAQNGTKDT